MFAVCVSLFVCVNMELKMNNDDEDDGKVIMQPKHKQHITAIRLARC